MPLLRSFLLVSLLFFPYAARSQQSAISNTTPAAPPQRDPQAVALLQRAVVAMGGNLPADSVATGTVLITAGSKSESGTVRILTRGSDQTVEEISTAETTRKIVYSRQIAAITEGATVRRASTQLAATSQNSNFPLPLLISIVNDPDAAFQFLGQESLDASPVYHLRLWNSFTPRPALQSFINSTMKDLWLDAASGLPRKLSFVHREADGPRAPSALIEVEFSDFRPVNGVAYPFLINKSLNGTPWLAITIQSVSLNTGLTDADFRVPTGRPR